MLAAERGTLLPEYESIIPKDDELLPAPTTPTERRIADQYRSSKEKRLRKKALGY